MTQSELERKALLTGAIVYTIMGACGWVAYYLSSSSALLLDGNYNLVNGIASIAGYFVAKIKENKTAVFPFGQFIYESLYSLIKGILVLGILVASLWENVAKLIDYSTKGTIHEINSKPIAIYAVAMVALSLGLSFYYKMKNRSIGNQSSMLKTDAYTATIDGLLTLVAGGGLLLVLFIGKNVKSLEFLQYVGDAIIVILFVIIAIKEPLQIIKHNFIDLAGGQLQSKSDREKIDEIIHSLRPKEIEVSDSFINKTGSFYLVVIYVKTKRINTDVVLNYRKEVIDELSKSYANSQVEILIN